MTFIVRRGGTLSPIRTSTQIWPAKGTTAATLAAMPRDPGKIWKQMKQCKNALFQCHSQTGGLVPVEQNGTSWTKWLKGINLLNLIPGATQLTQIRDGSFVQLWAALQVISKIWIEIAICIFFDQATLHFLLRILPKQILPYFPTVCFYVCVQAWHLILLQCT